MDYQKDKINKIHKTARPQGDSKEDQQQKYKHHQFANSTLNYYIERCDYLAAYTVAFSMLEDRLRAMAIVKHRDVLGIKSLSKLQLDKLSLMIDFVYPKNNDSLIFVENLATVRTNRNKLLHEAMWRTNAICLKDVDDVIGLRDIVASDLRKMKRSVQKQLKDSNLTG